MRQKPTSFIEIIGLWDTVVDFARAMSQPVGAKSSRVYQWRNRNLIEPDYWDDLIRCVALCHGIALTHSDLHAMYMATVKKRREQRQDAAA